MLRSSGAAATAQRAPQSAPPGWQVPTAHRPACVQVLVEYVWSAPSAVGTALKSKTRVLDSCTCLEDVPVISETVGDEPVVLRPRKLFADPFRPADRGYIVLCDAFEAPKVSSHAVWLCSVRPRQA